MTSVNPPILQVREHPASGVTPGAGAQRARAQETRLDLQFERTLRKKERLALEEAEAADPAVAGSQESRETSATRSGEEDSPDKTRSSDALRIGGGQGEEGEEGGAPSSNDDGSPVFAQGSPDERIAAVVLSSVPAPVTIRSFNEQLLRDPQQGSGANRAAADQRLGGWPVKTDPERGTGDEPAGARASSEAFRSEPAERRSLIPAGTAGVATDTAQASRPMGSTEGFERRADQERASADPAPPSGGRPPVSAGSQTGQPEGRDAALRSVAAGAAVAPKSGAAASSDRNPTTPPVEATGRAITSAVPSSREASIIGSPQASRPRDQASSSGEQATGPGGRLASFAARLFRGISGAVARAGGSGQAQELTLRLQPASLGQVRIRVQFDPQRAGLSARFEVTNSQARRLVDESLPFLRASLESRGLGVDALEVGVSPRALIGRDPLGLVTGTPYAEDPWAPEDAGAWVDPDARSPSQDSQSDSGREPGPEEPDPSGGGAARSSMNMDVHDEPEGDVAAAERLVPAGPSSGPFTMIRDRGGAVRIGIDALV